MAEPTQDQVKTEVEIKGLKPGMLASWGRPRLVTAIDLDGQVLRVVQATRQGGRVKVRRLAAERMPPGGEVDLADPASVGAWVGQALKRMRISAGKVVMGVPRGQVVLKGLSLPMADSVGELAAMVQFQMGKELHFKVEDAVIDFWLQRHHDTGGGMGQGMEGEGAAPSGGEAGGQQVEVLAAAVKRETVEYYQRMAAAAGLKLRWLGLRSYANVKSLRVCGVGGEKGQGVALIALRPDEVIIDVVADDALVFSRVAAVKLGPGGVSAAEAAAGLAAGADEAGDEANIEGSGDLQEAVLKLVATEVMRSLASYEGMEPHSPVKELVVAGDTGIEQAVVAHLGGRLKIPCRLLDPATPLGLDGGERMHASASIAAIGLTIGVGQAEGLPFDFLNPKKISKPSSPHRLRKIGVAAAALIALVSTMVVRNQLIAERERDNQEIQDRIDAVELRLPALKKLRAQARTVQDWAVWDQSWLDHLAYLSGVLPPATEVYITNYTVTAGGNIRFGLQARSGAILVSLDKKLREAGYVVRPLAVNPAADKFGYPFSTTVELENPINLKPDVKKAMPEPRPEDDISRATGGGDGFADRGGAAREGGAA